MPRVTTTTDPREGDYVLSPTGLTWNILRRGRDRNGASVSTGDRDRKVALTKVRSLAQGDRSDAWETSGTGVFWQIARFRQ
jgi:hypothetical protein